MHEPGTVEVPASPVCKDCSGQEIGKALKTGVFKLRNMIVTTHCCD